MRYWIWLIAACVLAASGPSPVLAEEQAFEPAALFLTWQQDPTTTMTIDWHTTPEDSERPSVVEYKPTGGEEWERAEGETHAFPYSERTIHRVELTDLEPANEYRFRVGEGSETYRFQTMPIDLNEPLVFATGGDTRHSQERMERTNLAAMEYEPDFIVWGGDLAYADGREDNLYRWYEWFDAVKNTLITEDGRVIPVLVAIGNHEVLDHFYFSYDDYEQTPRGREHYGPYFYSFFAFPGQPGYNALDFGDYLTIVLLDSEHSNPIEGEQTEWLEQVLAERTDRPHLFPVYHVPAFPSVRDFSGGTSWRIREHWSPLFEAYGVRVAFENHDHAYKRTYPIRQEEIHANGVTYIGDGAWGVRTREVHDPEETWYLKRADSTKNAIIVTLHGPHQHLLVIDEVGDVIDEYPKTPKR